MIFYNGKVVAIVVVVVAAADAVLLPQLESADGYYVDISSRSDFFFHSCCFVYYNVFKFLHPECQQGENW